MLMSNVVYLLSYATKMKIVNEKEIIPLMKTCTYSEE